MGRSHHSCLLGLVRVRERGTHVILPNPVMWPQVRNQCEPHSTEEKWRHRAAEPLTSLMEAMLVHSLPAPHSLLVAAPLRRQPSSWCPGAWRS
jgi:hypothetical protein